MVTYKLLLLSLIISFEGTVNGQFLTHNCAQHRARAKSKLAQGSDFVAPTYSDFDRSKLEDLFIPECEGNRVDYAPKQCFDMGRGICACATTNGTMLTDWSDKIKACNCIRAQDVAKRAAGYTGVPLCDQSGLFQTRQCIQHGWCDIVDPKSGFVVKGHNDLDSRANRHSRMRPGRPSNRRNRGRRNNKFESSENESEVSGESSDTTRRVAKMPKQRRSKNVKKTESGETSEEDRRQSKRTKKSPAQAEDDEDQAKEAEEEVGEETKKAEQTEKDSKNNNEDSTSAESKDTS